MASFVLVGPCFARVCHVQVDVTVLSRGDLEQMYIVKSEQLKAMTLQYEGVRPH